MGQGGKAGRIAQLETTQGFEHPDGMRAYGKNGLLVVEGASAGRFDMVELNGDNAEVKMVKSGFKQPVSVWQARTLPRVRGGVAEITHAARQRVRFLPST